MKQYEINTLCISTKTSIFLDEYVFADGHVYCVGMVIGLVLAEDQETAQRAARAVQVNVVRGGVLEGRNPKPLLNYAMTEKIFKISSF